MVWWKKNVYALCGCQTYLNNSKCPGTQLKSAKCVLGRQNVATDTVIVCSCACKHRKFVDGMNLKHKMYIHLVREHHCRSAGFYILFQSNRPIVFMMFASSQSRTSSLNYSQGKWLTQACRKENLMLVRFGAISVHNSGRWRRLIMTNENLFCKLCYSLDFVEWSRKEKGRWNQ